MNIVPKTIVQGGSKKRKEKNQYGMTAESVYLTDMHCPSLMEQWFDKVLVSHRNTSRGKKNINSSRNDSIHDLLESFFIISSYAEITNFTMML